MKKDLSNDLNLEICFFSFSNRGWKGGTVGYAWVNSMCGGNSNGINYVSYIAK